MANEIKKIEEKNITKTQEMNRLLQNKGVNQMFQNALQNNAGPFISSLIDLYNGDDYLQKCDAKEVMMEALKAATLNLPINKNLGFAYIVPYKGKATMTIGYKGYMQLAMRTGQYQALNAGCIFEGMELKQNYLAGTFEIIGSPKSNEVTGYFAYFKLINGFEKAIYMSKAEIEAHAKRYSQSYGSKYSPWTNEFDSMGQKTVMLRLLKRYGVLSTEMQQAIMNETDQVFEEEVSTNANVEIVENEVIDVETGEIITDTKAPF